MSEMGECWAITDGAAGNRRQALALAERLGRPVRELVLEARPPWSWFAPRLLPGGRLALPATERGLLQPPWPEVAIGCGRRAALFTRLLGRLGARRCYTVQILDPRIAANHWDTVIAPRHDHLAGANVLRPLGSLNPIDEAWLADGREANPGLAALPQPRLGVLLGGSRAGIALDDTYARTLLEGLLARHRRHGGSVLVLASRRTPAALVDAMRSGLRDVPGLVWAGEDDGRNPYPGVLGWADRLVVTPDSVNMLSEACAVGCAVHTLVAAPLPERLRDFHGELRSAGLLHDLDAEPPGRQAPLRETAAIAAELRRRIDGRASSDERRSFDEKRSPPD